MSSDLFFRLRVQWSGKTKGEMVIPIYAFKSDATGVNGGWRYGEVTLHTIETITDEVNKKKEITVCTERVYCNRALTDRPIEFFELHVKHYHIQPDPIGEKRTIATITGKDMKGHGITAVEPTMITMSTLGSPKEASAVKITFGDKLKFARV